jgi:hypothetical protein
MSRRMVKTFLQQVSVKKNPHHEQIPIELYSDFEKPEFVLTQWLLP